MTSLDVRSHLFPHAAEIPFQSYLQKYANQACIIVGRGPTTYDYQQLGESTNPIFFINDAVCLEKHARGETFFFAHDPQLLSWMDGRIQSTAILPIDGKLFGAPIQSSFDHTGNVVFYHWRQEKKEDLLLMNREQIAQLKQLYTHTGTIHSVLHFAWFCGFTKVTFIGCDGITVGTGYDPRLVNISGSIAGSTYPAIIRAQRLLTTLFGFQATYLGSPEPQALGFGSF
jgi:hypothetical protein